MNPFKTGAENKAKPMTPPRRITRQALRRQLEQNAERKEVSRQQVEEARGQGRGRGRGQANDNHRGLTNEQQNPGTVTAAVEDTGNFPEPEQAAAVAPQFSPWRDREGQGGGERRGRRPRAAAASRKRKREEEEYYVERVLDKRFRVEYKIKWEGYEETTWEREENVQNCSRVVEYEELLARRAVNIEAPPPPPPQQQHQDEDQEKEELLVQQAVGNGTGTSTSEPEVPDNRFRVVYELLGGLVPTRHRLGDLGDGNQGIDGVYSDSFLDLSDLSTLSGSRPDGGSGFGGGLLYDGVIDFVKSVLSTGISLVCVMTLMAFAYVLYDSYFLPKY